MKKFSGILLLGILLLSAGVAHAWVRVGFGGGGYGGWHGYYGGPRVGVYLSPGPYWWGDPYYYSGYYGPYYNSPYPYYDQSYSADAPVSSAPAADPVPVDNSRRDTKFVLAQIAHARDAVTFQYDDGDLTKAQRNDLMQRIDQIERVTREQAEANGGSLTADQERALLQALRGDSIPNVSSASTEEQEAQAAQDSQELATAPHLPRMTPIPGTAVANADQPRHDMQAVNEQFAHVRALLDKKLAAGDITKPQRDAELDYINQLEKVAGGQAQANGGKLSDNQENALRTELLHVDATIQRNLVAR